MMPETVSQARPDPVAGPTVNSAARVALLCDAPPLARLCAAALERLGLTPRLLPPAAEARRMLDILPPDLLVVLVTARDPAALALCQAVGQDPAFAGTRLVIVQDSARDIDIRRARALGADAVLPLPLDPAAFDRTILSLVSRTA